MSLCGENRHEQLGDLAGEGPPKLGAHTGGSQALRVTSQGRAATDAQRSSGGSSPGSALDHHYHRDGHGHGDHRDATSEPGPLVTADLPRLVPPMAQAAWARPRASDVNVLPPYHNGSAARWHLSTLAAASAMDAGEVFPGTWQGAQLHAAEVGNLAPRKRARFGQLEPEEADLASADLGQAPQQLSV